ncbi:hypothetical protein [Endozoicomonas euniceicola]|uniref:Uncharacterized protein n=1 Tax=Endozoicomonas euniceicola TaxID=1234143 RepID=A0ABY6GS28_9GAMM|nr:hypothetical protein [Endozoicomonas euniceicola]UYM14866.1 hypothetical protein NX720_18520 [Endozoicomonas euniceicola]
MENYFSDLDIAGAVDAVDAVAHGYTPLPEIDPQLLNYYERHRVRLLEQLIQEVTQRVTKRIVMQGLEVLTGNLADVVANIPAAVKTSRHLACLRSLLETESYECVCREGEGQDCKDIIRYVINQKSKKLARTGIDMIPGVSTLQAAGSKARAAYKFIRGTLGQTRGYMAYDLHKKMKTCSLAQAAAAEMLGSVYLPKCWVKAYTVRDWDEGWTVLQEKMESK